MNVSATACRNGPAAARPGSASQISPRTSTRRGSSGSSATPLRGSYNTSEASTRSQGARRTNSDGSVTIRLYRNGTLALQATDRGTGCAPLGAGHLGFRSDYLQYYVDNWNVTGNP